MKRQYLDFETFKRNALKDPEIKKEYDKLGPEFAVIDALIKARAKKDLTQKKLAVKMKTKQSVISRLESGRGNPSLAFLQRLAASLDSHLEIKFVEN